MINLLPDETKKQISAARTNITLVRYIVFLGFAIVFLTLACSTTYFILVNNKAVAERIIENGNLKTNSYSSVKKQADSLRNSLTTAKNILSQQTVYSSIITGIGATLPPGIILNELSLSNSTIGTPITILARARSVDDVTKLKANFHNSTLFSNFSVISQATTTTDSSGYPVEISISLTINKGLVQ